MSLHITHIELTEFRSWHRLRLDVENPLVILVGENATGKTNTIEAVELLTALTSFRHATTEQLVSHGEESAHLAIDVKEGTRELQIELHLADNRRRYMLNGKAKRPKDLKGLVPAVCFTPDDLMVVKGANAQRRHLIDALGSQLSAHYHQVLMDYEKVIHHKNRLLKDEAPDDYLEAVNELVITCGAQLGFFRANLIERLSPYVKSHYAEISSDREVLDLAYEPSWGNAQMTRDEARDSLAEALADYAERERAAHKSLVGPHADHITFLLAGKDASLFASQGQQRSIVLAEKLAEATLVEIILEKKPILLLDDVMSELDHRRRDALMSFLEDGAQAFITTVNLDYFTPEILAASQIVELSRIQNGCMQA